MQGIHSFVPLKCSKTCHLKGNASRFSVYTYNSFNFLQCFVFLLNTLPLIKSISVHVSVYQIFVLDCVEYLCFIPSNHQRTVKMSSVSRFLC